MRKQFYLFVVLAIFILSYWQSRDVLFERIYDLRNDTSAITSKEDIDEIFSSFNYISFQDLDTKYKNYIGANEEPYLYLLRNSQFAVISRKDLNKRIVGNHRLKEFVTKDKYYRRSLYSKNKKTYFIGNRKLLKKLLKLEQELADLEYNSAAIIVKSAYRTPKRNIRVGGASRSKHVLGEAIDIEIGDIDLDGNYSEEDKQIVLSLLENEIIGNKGGIGRYPGTRSLHFDVRGVRARWDEH